MDVSKKFKVKKWSPYCSDRERGVFGMQGWPEGGKRPVKLSMKDYPRLKDIRLNAGAVQAECDKLNSNIDDTQAMLRARENEALASQSFQFWDHLKSYEEAQLGNASVLDAVEQIRKILVKLVQAQKLDHPKLFTLSHYIEALSALKADRSLSSESLKRYRASFNHFLNYLVGQSLIDPNDCRLIHKMALKKVEEKSIKSQRRSVDLGANKKITIDRGSSVKVKALTLEQLHLAVESAVKRGIDDEIYVARAAYVHAMLSLRPGAFEALTVENIIEEGGDLYVVPEFVIQKRRVRITSDQKYSESWEIGEPHANKKVTPIVPVWHKAMADHVRYLLARSHELVPKESNNKWIFPHPSKRVMGGKSYEKGHLPIESKFYARIWKQVCLKANVPHVQVKHLRHTGASIIDRLERDMGMSSEKDRGVAQQTLGHTTSNTSRRHYIKSDYLTIGDRVYHGKILSLFQIGEYLDGLQEAPKNPEPAAKPKRSGLA